MDEVVFSPGGDAMSVEAAVVEFCYAPADTNADEGWEPCPDFPQPLTLPLFHPDYPATGNSGIDRATAEGVALGRVSYGDPQVYAGAPFSDLHDALVDLVSGGPGGPPMADPARASNVTGVSTGSSGSGPSPSMRALHPLDMVLLAAVPPAAAQMIGMYWVDRVAQPGIVYDYLLIADAAGSAFGKPFEALSHWAAGALGYEGYAAFGLEAAPAPPLALPTGARVYSLPLGTVFAPGGPAETPVPVAGLAGLRWGLPLNSGSLLPRSAVGYHIWREALGGATLPGPSVDLGDWLTKPGPVLVGAYATSGFSSPQYPSDWPNEQMYRIDRVQDEGWYGYTVAGMDLFGRISPPASPAAWHQWVPVPSPKPWYYVDPPADREIHPSAVRVLDKTPPPQSAWHSGHAARPARPIPRRRRCVPSLAKLTSCGRPADVDRSACELALAS